MIRQFSIFIALVAMLSSCKELVPYSDSLRQKNNWGEPEIKRIQFYTSSDLIIQRKIVSGSTEIISGKIKMIDGEQVEEILIRKGTPGVVTQIPKQDKLFVSFELNDDHYLSFGVNPNRGERYYLLAKEWNRKVGKIFYNGKEFYCSPESADVFLMIDLHQKNTSDVNAHVAKGRKIN